jgi:hypothetical protein
MPDRQKLGKNCAANIRNLAATAGRSAVKEVCERIAAFSILRRASRLHFRVDVDATRRVASRRVSSRLISSRRSRIWTRTVQVDGCGAPPAAGVGRRGIKAGDSGRIAKAKFPGPLFQH